LLLGEYLGLQPDAVPLWYTSFGKPGLSGEAAGSGVKFNVSHSAGLMLAAVTRNREVGIDVERVRPDVDWRELAGRFFAPAEVAALDARPPDDQLRAFFACWTRKEAYVKALGLGMSLPLDQFSVSVAPHGPAALLTAEHDPAQLTRWELHVLDAGADFAATLAVEGRGGQVWSGRWPLNP